MDFKDPWDIIRDLTERLNILLERMEKLEDRLEALEQPSVTVTVGQNGGMSFDKGSLQDEPPVQPSRSLKEQM